MSLFDEGFFQVSPWDGAKESLLRTTMTYVWAKYHLTRSGKSPVDYYYRKNLGDGRKVAQFIHQLQGGDIAEIVASYFENSDLHLIATALLQTETMKNTAGLISGFAKNFDESSAGLLEELTRLVDSQPGMLNPGIISRGKAMSPDMVSVQYMEPSLDNVALEVFRDDCGALIPKHFGMDFSLWGDNFWIEEREAVVEVSGSNVTMCRKVAGFCDMPFFYLPSRLREEIWFLAPWIEGVPDMLRLYPDNHRLLAASLAFKPQLSPSRPTLVERWIEALRNSMGLDTLGCADQFEKYLLETYLGECHALVHADGRMVEIVEKSIEREVALDLMFPLMSELLAAAHALESLRDKDDGLLRQFHIALLLSNKEANGDLTPCEIFRLRALVDIDSHYLFDLIDRMEKLFLKDGVQRELQIKRNEEELNFHLQDKTPIETEFDAWLHEQIDNARQDAGAILGARYGEI